MIEKFRNYSGLMIVVLVALFVSFLFSDISGSKRGGGGGGTAFVRIDGTTYDTGNFEKEGVNGYSLAMGLQMFDLMALAGGFGQPDSQEQFFVNRMLVRDAAEQFGIHPDKAEIDAYIKGMQVFGNPTTREFDPERYRNIVTEGLGRQGMSEGDLFSLVSDALIVNKLQEVVASGLEFNRDMAAAGAALASQKLTVQLARIGIAPFKEAMKPTEEELKAYWETIPGAFKTDARRKFTYVLATPAAPETKPEAPKPEGDNKDSADGKKPEDAPKPDKPDPTKEDPGLIAERRKKEMELSERLSAVLDELQTTKGSDFEKVVAAQGFEVKKTEWFTRANPPADFALNLRSSGGRPTRAGDALFQLRQTSDPLSRISEPLGVGENQYILARLDEEEAPRDKTFEEAKEQVTTQYIEEKAREAMRKDADAKLAKVREAMKAGKSFADATKEAGLESKPVASVDSAFRPTGEEAPASLFMSLRLTDPGSVGELIVEDTAIFIPFVEKREVVKLQPAMIDGQMQSVSQAVQYGAFSDWLEERKAKAKVERLNRIQP